MDLSSEDLARLHAETKGPATIAIVITFTTVAFLTVFLRFYTRFCVGRNHSTEDYVIGFAMAFAIIMCVVQVLQVQAGSGRHAIFVSPEETSVQLKWLWGSILAYAVAITSTKISILYQYRRIFHTSKGMMIAINVVGAWVLCFGISLLFTGILNCLPVRAFWDLSLRPTAKCVNQYAVWITNAAINIATDLSITILPLRSVWQLNLPTQKKIAVSFIFAIGFFVCIVSMLRLNALVVMQKHQNDQSFFGADSAWWSAIEVDLAIICASLPPLRRLMSSTWRQFRSDQSYGSNISHTHNSQVRRTMQGPPADEELGPIIGRKELGFPHVWGLESAYSVNESEVKDGESRQGSDSEESHSHEIDGAQKSAWLEDA